MNNSLKSFLQNNKFNIIIGILWFILCIITMFHHEIWRDEAQVWCLVRDCSLSEIFNMIRVEGHPFLWYLTTLPLAKIGLPVISMQFESLILVFISVIFLLFKSPFNKFQKLIIIFSAGMIYYLPVISRNYSLIPIFILILAYLYPKRKEKPYFYIFCIAILSHTHFYMLGFCTCLFLLNLYEEFIEFIKNKNIKTFIPSFILAINFLIIFLIFRGTETQNYALDETIKSVFTLPEILVIIPKILTYNLFEYWDFTRKNFTYLSILLFYPFLLIYFFYLIKTDKKIAFIFAYSLSTMITIFINIYFNGILYQKTFLIFLIMIFCSYVCLNQNSNTSTSIKKIGNISFCALFVISSIISPIVINEDIKYNFSGGKEIASYIKHNIDDEKIFIGVGSPYLYSSISAYLPDKKFYSLVSQSYISYFSFAKANNNNIVPFPENAKYSIIQQEIIKNDSPYLTFIFKSKNENISSKTQREVFSIYKEK